MVQPNQGVYMLAPGASTAVELISTLSQPNGIGLSLDGHTLYVDDNGDGVMTYAVNADGTIVTPGTPLDPTDLAHKSGDGVAFDCAGDFYVVINSATIYVVSPAGSTSAPSPASPAAARSPTSPSAAPTTKPSTSPARAPAPNAASSNSRCLSPGMPY